MNRFGLSIFCGFVAGLLSTGCAHRSPEDRELQMPATFSQPEGRAISPNAWWMSFEDPQLNRWMEKALQGNLSLEQAEARLRQAEAVADQVGAERYPTLDLQAGAGTSSRKSSGSARESSDQFSLGLAAGYEVDLWGRVAAANQSAEQRVMASAFDLQAAGMTVAAQTCAAYFDWQYFTARRELLQQQLQSRQKILAVIEKRFQTAQATVSEVLQQRERVAAAEAQLPPVEAALQSAAHTLQVLVGEFPGGDPGLVARALVAPPAPPQAGLPVDLLIRRPDLQAGWARLASADWDLKAAEANRLPTLRLSGAARYEGAALDEIFDSWFSNLAAGLTAPLIDGGRLKAEAARAQALSDERLADYREQVLKALAEVENALVNERHQQEYVAAVSRQLTASSRSTEAAFNRYSRGQDSFFEALVQETARQSLEASLLQAQADLLTDRIQLYRALGGDWQSILLTYRKQDDE